MKHLMNTIKYRGDWYYISTCYTYDAGLETMIFKYINHREDIIDWKDLYCEHYETTSEATSKHRYIVQHIEEFIKIKEKKMNENGEILLAFDKETGELKEYEEPFATMDFQTEEDYKHFEEVLKFWKENHKGEK